MEREELVKYKGRGRLALAKKWALEQEHTCWAIWAQDGEFDPQDESSLDPCKYCWGRFEDDCGESYKKCLRKARIRRLGFLRWFWEYVKNPSQRAKKDMEVQEAFIKAIIE